MRLFVFTFILLSLFSCSHQVKTTKNIRQEIAKILIVSCDGPTAKKGTDFHKVLTKYPVAGVLLFDTRPGYPNRNVESPEQLKSLTKELKELRPNMLIAVDQEGGAVSRLGPELGFNKFLAPAQFAQLPKKKQIKESVAMAREIKNYGINLNLAPLVDVNRNSENFINKRGRSFSSDTKSVVENAGNFINGHHQENVLTALKHFPGHGSSRGDSHHGMVDVTTTWHKTELDPYKELIKTGDADMIMTAHIFLRSYDKKYPATLSKKIINGLLRQELGYQGVVISDDLKMKAIAGRYPKKEALRLMINAGVDIMLISQSNFKEVEEVITLIKELLTEGKVKWSSLEKSINRIDTMKKKHAKRSK